MYIYFDFECTKKNGIHVPNLCVAHRVCQHCGHLKVDQPCSHCEHLGPRRHLFRGSETLKQYMEWLFQAQPHATKKSQIVFCTKGHCHSSQFQGIRWVIYFELVGAYSLHNSLGDHERN